MSKQKSTYEKRKEILESPYRNGVISVDGESLGIRPMTEKECAFLDKFNSEFGCANVSYDEPGLHSELVSKNQLLIKDIKRQIENKKVELDSFKTKRGEKTTLSKEEKEHVKEIKISLRKEIEQLKEQLKSLDVIADIRHDNYARSCDPLNFKRYRINFLDIGTNGDIKSTKTQEISFTKSETEKIENLEEAGIVSKT